MESWQPTQAFFIFRGTSASQPLIWALPNLWLPTLRDVAVQAQHRTYVADQLLRLERRIYEEILLYEINISYKLPGVDSNH